MKRHWRSYDNCSYTDSLFFLWICKIYELYNLLWMWKICLLTFMGLSPSYYLSDFFVCTVEWVTMGVAHPYSNPFGMANVLCQDILLAVITLPLLMAMYFTSLSCIRVDVGKVSSTGFFSTGTRSSAASLTVWHCCRLWQQCCLPGAVQGSGSLHAWRPLHVNACVFICETGLEISQSYNVRESKNNIFRRGIWSDLWSSAMMTNMLKTIQTSS